jgi:hypothetical protein
MGKLLALSPGCTFTSAALLQPAPIGEPRRTKAKSEPKPAAQDINA